MKPLFLFFSFFFIHNSLVAGKISGKVTAASGEVLAYSTITVQGKNIYANANAQGYYFLELSPGTYTISCRHVGYERSVQTITVSNDAQELNFE